MMGREVAVAGWRRQGGSPHFGECFPPGRRLARPLSGLAAGILYASTGVDTRAAITQAILGPYPDGRDSSWHTAGGEELLRANNDPFNIAMQIARCFPGVNFSWDNDGPPGEVSVAFMLNLQPSGEETWGKPSSPAHDITLTNLQRAVLTISRSAAGTRAELAAAAAQSRASMRFYQWLSVIIGATTTILVSIKSMSNGTAGDRGYFVGIFAVVFSALGTAIASINSFEGPNDAYVRSERGLLQVRQLHLELALQVAQEQDLCRGFDPNKADEPRARRMADLSVRLKELVASSGSSGNVPSTTGGAGSSGSSSSASH
jgi:hypothetical protein